MSRVGQGAHSLPGPLKEGFVIRLSWYQHVWSFLCCPASAKVNSTIYLSCKQQNWQKLQLLFSLSASNDGGLTGRWLHGCHWLICVLFALLSSVCDYPASTLIPSSGVSEACPLLLEAVFPPGLFSTQQGSISTSVDDFCYLSFTDFTLQRMLHLKPHLT